MQDMQTSIILLTVIVSILSFLTIVLMILLIVILVKARRVVKRIDDTTATIAKAVDWLSPSRIFSEIVGFFSKDKS